jgi:hypothetical protein
MQAGKNEFERIIAEVHARATPDDRCDSPAYCFWTAAHRDLWLLFPVCLSSIAKTISGKFMKSNVFFLFVMFAVQSAALADVPKSIFDDDWKPDTPQQMQAPVPVTPTPNPSPAADATPATAPVPHPPPDSTAAPVPAPAPLSPAPAPAAVRLAVPTAAAQANSWKLIKEDLYKDDIANARTSAQKVELAGKLLAVAQDTNNDPPGKYVLLAQAKELAISSGDPPTAFKCLDELGEAYNINYPVMKLDLFAALAKTVSSRSDGKVLVDGLNRWGGHAGKERPLRYGPQSMRHRPVRGPVE